MASTSTAGPIPAAAVSASDTASVSANADLPEGLPTRLEEWTKEQTLKWADWALKGEPDILKVLTPLIQSREFVVQMLRPGPGQDEANEAKLEEINLKPGHRAIILKVCKDLWQLCRIVSSHSFASISNGRMNESHSPSRPTSLGTLNKLSDRIIECAAKRNGVSPSHCIRINCEPLDQQDLRSNVRVNAKLTTAFSTTGDWKSKFQQILGVAFEPPSDPTKYQSHCFQQLVRLGGDEELDPEPAVDQLFKLFNLEEDNVLSFSQSFNPHAGNSNGNGKNNSKSKSKSKSKNKNESESESKSESKRDSYNGSIFPHFMLHSRVVNGETRLLHLNAKPDFASASHPLFLEYKTTGAPGSNTRALNQKQVEVILQAVNRCIDQARNWALLKRVLALAVANSSTAWLIAFRRSERETESGNGELDKLDLVSFPLDQLPYIWDQLHSKELTRPDSFLTRDGLTLVPLLFALGAPPFHCYTRLHDWSTASVYSISFPRPAQDEKVGPIEVPRCKVWADLTVKVVHDEDDFEREAAAVKCIFAAADKRFLDSFYCLGLWHNGENGGLQLRQGLDKDELLRRIWPLRIQLLSQARGQGPSLLARMLADAPPVSTTGYCGSSSSVCPDPPSASSSVPWFSSRRSWAAHQPRCGGAVLMHCGLISMHDLEQPMQLQSLRNKLSAGPGHQPQSDAVARLLESAWVELREFRFCLHSLGVLQADHRSPNMLFVPSLEYCQQERDKWVSGIGHRDELDALEIALDMNTQQVKWRGSWQIIDYGLAVLEPQSHVHATGAAAGPAAADPSSSTMHTYLSGARLSLMKPFLAASNLRPGSGGRSIVELASNRSVDSHWEWQSTSSDLGQELLWRREEDMIMFFLAYMKFFNEVRSNLASAV
jgi:hypothetical protein